MTRWRIFRRNASILLPILIWAKPRQLAPAKCLAKVVDNKMSKVSQMEDPTGCHGNNYQRVFVRDVVSNSTSEKSLLREIKPIAHQTLSCPETGDCNISMSGYGLQKDDYLALFPGSQCGSSDIFEPLRLSGVSAMTLQVGFLASDTVDIMRTTGVLNIDSEYVKAGREYTLCYASKLGFDDDEVTPTKEDYIYNVGSIKTTKSSAYICDFEGGSLSTCGLAIYRPRQDVDFEWRIASGASTTPGTGPEADHTENSASGHYATMKSPGYMQDSSSATLIGPAMFGSKGSQCLTFAFNMYGEDVNALRVYIIKGNMTETSIGLSSDKFPRYSEHNWGTPRWVAVGNKGQAWHVAGIPIASSEAEPFHVVFEALAGKSEKGDIAIDDLKLSHGDCPSATRTHPKSTIGDSNMVCGEVRMLTGNHPEDKSWSLEGAVSCSGHGYSMSELRGAWVPCCVPHFGSYTMLLRDALNDGWDGSRLELRFFDKTYTFGAEMKHRSGDVKIPIVIGQLDILRATYKEETINVSVRVTTPNSFVWCGVTEALNNGEPRQPPPSAQLMKDYGVRYADATTEPGQVCEIAVTGEFIKPSHTYDVYCYTTSANPESDDGKTMDEDQIAATRYRIIADIEAPIITAVETQVSDNRVNVTLHSSEAAKVWCLANMIPTSVPVTKDLVQLRGEYIEFDNAGDKTLIFDSLASEAVYKLHCYAQDLSDPEPNCTSDDELAAGVNYMKHQQEVKFSTGKRYPKATIKHVAIVNNGFDVEIGLDGSGIVHCAAAPEGIDFPSSQEVIDAGAFAKLSKNEFVKDALRDVRVTIRGVKPKTSYKIFCVSASSDGSLRAGDKEMWKNSVPAVSYGRFCDIPASPQTAIKDEAATPFDPLTSEEELSVRRFMLSQKDLNLSAVYRVNLFHNKSEIYNYYDNNGPLPPRYARVRIGRCVENRGFYEQLRVGPLNETDHMTIEAISMPVETTCGGYNAEGIFGRRLLVDDFETGFQDLMRASFGAPFGSIECLHASECLRLGAVAVDSPKNPSEQRLISHRDTDIWVGLKRATGQPVPLYFQIQTKNLNLTDPFDPAVVPKLLDDYDWRTHSGKVWYDGQLFDNLNELVRAWRNSELKVVTLDKLEKRRRMKPTMHKRRLAPSPYGGGPGTAGVDLNRQTKRSGLEYRIPPEHIEPGGKRYTVKAHPGGQSYTIEYSGWSFTVTNDRDKSMQMWNLIFQNERIAFQLGLQEAMAHYTVSERTFFFMDSWYGGLGGAARPVLRGYECPKHGTLVFYDQSLCVWEQDMARPIRSHYRSGEIRDAAAHYALHIRQMVTVSNYDYVTTYVFHPSGHVEAKVEFTGELYAGVEVPWYSQRQTHYGTLVTGAMRMAALHAHLVIWKIDFDLEDYLDNSVWFEHVIPDPKRLGANYIDRFFPDGELAGAIGVNDTRNVAYEIVSEKRNTYGNYGGWRILPGHSWSPNQPHSELYSGTGSWAKYKVFSTQFKYSELDATLPRDNKFAGDPAVSVDRFIGDNESLRHTDVVTWSSMSFMHIPCSEDYPLTVPIGNTLSIMIRPNNWFLEDPSMDLHNALGGDFRDPGQCAVVRKSIFDVMDTKNAKGPIMV